MLITTSYRLHLSKFLKDCVDEYKNKTVTGRESKLLLHQYLCVRYFSEKKPRGILLYQLMGTGKTFAGVALCESIIDQCKGIIFIAKKSVHENFRSTVERYSGSVSSKYKFVSMGASNMKDIIIRYLAPDLAVTIDENQLDANGFLFVVDEAHNLFSSITNGSNNAVYLYRLIMRSNCRIIFMTGSPALKEVYELGIAFNMLAGKLSGGQTLFGENYEHFNNYFIADTSVLNTESKVFSSGTRNMDVFGDRITGLVSFYKPPPEVEAEHFPKMYGPFVILSHMSNWQYELYKFYRARERKEEAGSKGVGPQDSFTISKGSKGTYRVMTRQISNYAYPEHTLSKKYNNRGDLIYEHDISKLSADDFTIEALERYSPKLLSLMLRIHAHSGVMDDIAEYAKRESSQIMSQLKDARIRISPGIIYSQYLDFGLNIIGLCLEHHGFAKFTSMHVDRNKPRYAVISGEVDKSEQMEVIQAMNDPANADGSVLRLLLISATGAEGLDLKRIGHVHIYEPHWHDSRHRQVAARAHRYDGCIDLPLEDRNYCVYVYLSDYPLPDSDNKKASKHGAPKDVDEVTTDIALYKKALGRQSLIDKFLDTLQINAFDCVIHNNENLCRICSPTDESLIINSLEKHIEYGSRCIINQTEDVNAYPFEYNGKEYYCYKNKGTIIVLYYNELYGEHVELNPGDDNFYDIITKASVILSELPTA